MRFEKSGLRSLRRPLSVYTQKLIQAELDTLGVGAELSVLYCSPSAMRRFKNDYLGIDEETDVLSFPSGEKDYLGDIAISLTICARQARARGVKPEAELALLLTHGLLHLLGHDHDTKARRDRMWRVQNQLLRATKTIRAPKLVIAP